MKAIKKLCSLLLVLVLSSLVTINALAVTYFDFGGTNGTGAYIAGGSYSYGEAKVLEKLYTRTGPSTDYEEGGSANIAGQKVKVYGFQPDENGVRWIIVDIRYGSKLRRVYTKSMYLDMDSIAEKVFSSYEADKCGYYQCVITSDVQPKYGPGFEYESHEKFLRAGTRGSYLYSENGYALVDYGSIRLWVPENAVTYWRESADR